MAKSVNDVAEEIAKRIETQVNNSTTNKVQVDVFIEGNQIKQIGERYHLRNAHVDELVDAISSKGYNAYRESNGIRVVDERDDDAEISLVNKI